MRPCDGRKRPSGCPAVMWVLNIVTSSLCGVRNNPGLKTYYDVFNYAHFLFIVAEHFTLSAPPPRRPSPPPPGLDKSFKQDELGHMYTLLHFKEVAKQNQKKGKEVLWLIRSNKKLIEELLERL